MSTNAAPIAPALRVLLERVVDYAGLFPPAALAMRDAAGEYASSRSSSNAWMLGRFVVPIARLGELAATASVRTAAEQATWPLSVLLSADPMVDTVMIRAFGERHRGRFMIESLELPAASVEAIDRALSQLDHALERYVEIPLDADPRPLLHAIARHGGRAKVRTGGVTPEAFPAAAELARFIAACAELDVPFKATAGLHHPLRGTRRLTYDQDSASAVMFGFLGVFSAAALARSGADEDTLVQLLEERDPGAFSFSDRALCWRGHTVAWPRLAASRREFAISFGSCSFREPVDDLQRLGLL